MAMCVTNSWTGTAGYVSDDTFSGSWDQVQERLEGLGQRTQCWPVEPEVTPELTVRAWKDLEGWFGVGIRRELATTPPAQIVRIWIEL